MRNQVIEIIKEALDSCEEFLHMNKKFKFILQTISIDKISLRMSISNIIFHLMRYQTIHGKIQIISI